MKLPALFGDVVAGIEAGVEIALVAICPADGCGR